MKTVLAFVTIEPPPAVILAAAAEHGIAVLGDPGAGSTHVNVPSGAGVPGTPMTPLQGELLKALTSKPLNPYQTAVLQVYLLAYQHGLPPLSISAVAEKIGAEFPEDAKRAENLVKGALRSFGRRLAAVQIKIPTTFAFDQMGGPGLDEVPLLALIAISKGPFSEARHKLTSDGAAAVAAALGATKDGGDDDAELVMLGMSKLTAALIHRVWLSRGGSLDDAIRHMAALAGAG